MEYLKNNVMALMPCAVKIPMEEKVSAFARKNGLALKYEILSNAVVQEDVFGAINTSKNITDLPDVMIAPGFSPFFHKPFIEGFIEKGFFKSCAQFEVSDVYKEAGVIDPAGIYDIIAVNPLIFLVDKTNYPDLTPPEKWDDLLSPDYEKRIAFRGHTPETLCEGVLFGTYQAHGFDGITRIARNLKQRLHPAQMVALAGTKKREAPFISVIPLSFANLVKETENVKIVWPRDGAYMNPLVMLTKKDCPPDAQKMSQYFVGEEAGTLLSTVGFCSIIPESESKMPRRGNYKWLGWDFLRSNDLGTLHNELNRHFNEHQEA